MARLPMWSAALLCAVVLPLPAQIVRTASASLLARHNVAAGTVQSLSLPVGRAAGSVRVEFGGIVRTLKIAPHDVRAPGFQLLLQTARGTQVLPKPLSVTWRGSVVSLPSSAVAATLVDGGLRAIVDLGQGSYWVVEPLVRAAGGRRSHLVYDARNVLQGGHTCGVAPGPRLPPLQPQPSGRTTVIADIAIDADSHFLQLHGGNTTNVHNDVTGVINAVATIFKADVGIDYLITAILVRTQATNPYTTNNPGVLLGQFAGEWNGNQSAITRDLAHLFTGRNLTGSVIGIAYVASVCTGGAYGVSQSLFTANFAARVALTAHELGHNWSAQHCNGQSDCRIMCSGLGGCSGVLTSFGSGAKGQMNSYKLIAPCIGPGQPATLSAIQPGSLVVTGGAPATLTGTGLDLVKWVSIGGQVVSRVQPIGSTQLTFTIPHGTVIGSVPVTVENGSGASNQVSFTYQEVSQPTLDVPALGIGGMTTGFAFYGGAQDIWFLIGSLSATTAPLQGFPILQPRFDIAFGAASSVGYGQYLLVPPVGVLQGVTVYSQVVFVDPATVQISGVSNLGATFFLF